MRDIPRAFCTLPFVTLAHVLVIYLDLSPLPSLTGVSLHTELDPGGKWEGVKLYHLEKGVSM